MRNDWPVGYNEDCIEPPCEIFLQLFIGNEMVAEDIPINNDLDFPHTSDGYEPDENEGDEPLQNYGALPISEDDLEDLSVSSSDDYLSSDPSIQSISDTTLPSTEEESNDENYGIQYSLSDISQFSEDSWFPDNISNISVTGHNQESDVFLEEISVESASAANNQSSEICDEASSNVDCEETGNCGGISSHDLQHPEESAVDLETSSSNNGLPSSTYVSLYVVVPPTNFSNESGSDLLPEISSDRLFPGVIPLNPPHSPAPLIPDNVNIQSVDPSLQNSSKTSSGMHFDATLALRNTTSAEEDVRKSHNLATFNSLLNSSKCTESDFKSDSNSIFNDSICIDLYSEYPPYDDNLNDESVMVLESNSNSEIASEKSLPSLKRKVCSSTDDSVVNKVPKYASSQASDETVTQGPLDYCRVLSNNSEKTIPHEEDKMDTVPPVVGENVILTLGKAVEETSVVNEKPKSR